MSDNSRNDAFGARWWRESLLGRWSTRLIGGAGFVGGAALALGSGCATTYGDTRMDEVPSQSQDAVEVDKNVDALTLQKMEGWNTGVTRPLMFPGSTEVDISGTQSWRDAMQPLPQLLEPPPQYLPFYVPTLFQSLQGDDGQGLRAVMRPILTPEMQDDFQRGVALRLQFAQADWPRDTAIVVDAPGPRAVAIAAALADHFAPVFTFGNWPHPLGVVPAHQTLAASLYYLPAFSMARSLRPPDAPPVFVLDANRLAPYRDADNEFDNRYFASLPTAESLRALGIKHVLYVGDGQQELDDLNDQLVAMQGQGLDVKMVALGDFVRVDGETEELRVASDEASDVGDDDDDTPSQGQLAWWWSSPCHWWYRGAWWQPGAFWVDYGWYPPPRPVKVVGPPPGRRMYAAIGPHWVPAPRPTMFGRPGRVGSAPVGMRGVMHPVPPPHFATVSVRALRESGEITGVRAGHVGSFAPGGGVMSGGGHVVGVGGLGGRSGSIGRAGGGMGG